MKIRSIEANAVKVGTRYELAGQSDATKQLPGSDYIRFPPYAQLYSQLSEAMIVRIETDEGVVGWGEAQAPIGPEVAQTIVERVIGPAVLGQNALDTSVRFSDMYETLRVRGQVTGYQLDAIAAIDTALWDIKGKVAGRSVSELLGGRFRDTLPSYITGLRAKSREARADEAKAWIEAGHKGVKPCLGNGVRQDAAELESVRAAIGDEAELLFDGVWQYSFADAVRIGRVCEDLGVGFFESPLVPEDIDGHARLAAELDVAIAVGEPLRTRFQFQPWFRANAMDVAQPDVMRNGITETMRIAAVAEAFNKPVALHTGTLTVVGMSASWQTAAALPNFLIQEYQPVMLKAFNEWLREPLKIHNGHLVVPKGPGLGLDIDEQRFRRDVDSSVKIGD